MASCVYALNVIDTGRVWFRTTIPNKSSPTGLKLYVCADSHTSYALALDVKTFGHTGPTFEGTKVAMKLLRESGVLNSGRTLVTDNYYTSVELSKAARDEGTYTLGILRQSRVPQGEILSRACNVMMNLLVGGRMLTARW